MNAYDLTLFIHREGWTDYLITVTDFLIFFITSYKLLTNQTLSSSALYNAAWGVVAIGSLWKAVVSTWRLMGHATTEYLHGGWALQPFGIFLVIVSTLGVRKAVSENSWILPWKRDRKNR